MPDSDAFSERTVTEPPEFSTADLASSFDEEAEPTGVWDRIPKIAAWDTALLVLAWSALFTLTLLFPSATGAIRLADWGASVTPWRGLADVWRLLASTFLHATPAHLLSNLVTLAILGPSTARLFGRSGYWVLYVLGGAAASMVSVLWRTAQVEGPSASVGGSGVLFAWGGAMGAAAWRLRRWLPPGRARALGGGLLVLLGSGLVAGLTREATDTAAHLGGAAAGLLLGLALRLRSLDRPDLPVPMRTLGGLAAAIAVAALSAAIWSGLTHRQP